MAKSVSGWGGGQLALMPPLVNAGSTRASVCGTVLTSPRPLPPAPLCRAQKNHTAHNQTRKAHRNGITKPQRQRFTSRKG